MELKVKKLHPDAKLPTRAHQSDLGYDIFALETVYLIPGEVMKIRTGIAVNFPKGYGAVIKDRSSMALKGFHVSGGVIDETYSSEISVLLTYITPVSGNRALINKGDKIAQLIPTQVVNWDVSEVDELEELERGSNGFGSSDLK
jgi:dUTP pyrophosphatase